MNISDINRDLFMLEGKLAKEGYDWWWHNFTAYDQETKEERSFFIEYFVCNPSLGGEQPVFGQLQNNKENNMKPSYAMIKVGTWGLDAKQIHNFYGIKQFSYDKHKLNIKIGNNILTEKYMKGSCSLTKEDAENHPEYMSNYGSIEWNIKIDKKIAFNVGYGASKFFRKINAFEMFWHAEGIKTEYSGTILYNGRKYDVIKEKSYGYDDKNWGKDFTSPWLWLSGCNMRSLITKNKLNNSAFEAGGGKPKIFGFPLNNKILIGMYYEGKMYEYNFSKIFSKSKIIFSFEESDFNKWVIVAINKYSRLEVCINCPSKEMLLINYEAPNGEKLHNKLWNGGTGYGEIKLYNKKNDLIDHIEIKNVGCEYGEY